MEAIAENCLRKAGGKQPFFLLVLLLITLITPTLSASKVINKTCSNSNLCLTKSCVLAASNIISKIDESVDPCEDFHKFACGGFLKKMNIPDDMAMVNSFSEILKVLDQNLRSIVEPDIHKNDHRTIKMIKTFYKTCKDTDAIEEQGLAPLEKVLRKLGGWPVVEGEKWDEENFSWVKSLYLNKKLGYSFDIFFDLGVYSDFKNSSWRSLSIDQPSLGVSRKHLVKGFDDPNVQFYYNLQVKFAELLGADKEIAEKQLKQSIEFEIEIANLITSKEERKNLKVLYNKMSIEELDKHAPEIPWLEFINELLMPHFNITKDEPVIVYASEYIKEVAKLIEKTSNRTLSNFLQWNVVKSSVPYLNKEINRMFQEYEANINGVKKEKQRWITCISEMIERNHGLAFALSAAYVKKYFKKDAKKSVDELVEYIHDAFEDILMKVDWMDDKTKKRAKEKSEAIIPKIAYPPELLNDTIVEEYYEHLFIENGDYLEQKRNLTIFVTDEILRSLREKVDKAEWKTYGNAAIVNAFYDSVSNSIKFPAGILQVPFFGADRPQYLNFGAIGSIIGHEITHGFDQQGRQFDGNGDLDDWWEDETAEKFNEKIKCFVEQYSHFTVSEIHKHLNGNLTEEENVADNGSVKEAYYGYRLWLEDNDEESQLPGLDYSPKQLFWLSYANNWCGKKRPERLKEMIFSDCHSPERFRVNGPLLNSVEFANDWKCDEGSAMNPKHKCEVW